jgi:dCMP deaminase
MSENDTSCAERPDWDEYFMNIAHVVKTRGNCCRRKVAAVIAKDRRLISTGYNGTPRGVKNCYEGGCARCASDAPSGSGLGECICSHAEENAITQAAYHGTSVRDGVMYVTISPCLMCAKMIINAGIREVVYDGDYKFTEQTKALLDEAGVICRRFGD